MKFDFSSLFLFSGIINAVIGLLYIISTRKSGNRGVAWLTALLIILIIILVECIFRNSGLTEQFPHILFISTVGFFALPPVVYCYQSEILGRKTVVWKHFIISALALLFMLPTYLMNAHDKITMFTTKGLHDPIWIVAVYVAYFIFYQFQIFNTHYEYKRKLNNVFSDTLIEWEKISSRIISITGFSALAIPSVMVLQYLSIPHTVDLIIAKSVTVLFSLTPHFVVVSLLLRREVVRREVDRVPEPVTSKVSEADLEIRKEELNAFIQSHQCFLENDLTLDALAHKIGWNRSLLSSVINTGFGQNFYDFVNSFRLTALDQQLESRAHLKYSLDHIVRECGFTSYVTFYRFFKRTKGKSPSAYLKSFEDTVK